MRKISLDSLKEGQSGTVLSVDLSGDMKYRLLDIGIIPGTKIKVVKTAPLGDPIQIELMGYSICIRKETARKIIVEVNE